MLRSNGGRLAVVAGALAVWTMAVPLPAQQIGRAPLEVRVPATPTAASALGRWHLAYEIHVTNFSAMLVRVDRMEAVSGSGTTLGTWSGTQLRQRAMILGQQDVAGTGASLTLAPGQRAVLVLWVTLDPQTPAPDALVHRITTMADDGAAEIVTTLPLAVRAADRAPLGSPVRGGPWVAVRGPSPTSGHRLSLVAIAGIVGVPQRFAVDWARLGDTGTLFRDDGSRVTDWFSYGGEGLPFSIDGFELVGRVAGLGPILAGTPWTPQAAQPSRTVTAEMPLENMVVTFAA